MPQELKASVESFLLAVVQALEALPRGALSEMFDVLCALREGGGRLFVIGVGGSLANASHAANDLRKVGGIEAYNPWDAASELTAWINDETWEESIVRWLRGSRFGQDDVLLVLSVSGGDPDGTRSSAIGRAVEYADSLGSRILAVTGNPHGLAASVGDMAVVVGSEPRFQYAVTEILQAVVWHLLALLLSETMEGRDRE